MEKETKVVAHESTGSDAVQKHRLASAKPRLKEQVCKRQTRENRVRNPPEIERKFRIILLDQKVCLLGYISSAYIVKEITNSWVKIK